MTAATGACGRAMATCSPKSVISRMLPPHFLSPPGRFSPNSHWEWNNYKTLKCQTRPFFSLKSTQNSTCPESHIIQCQKSNGIVLINLFPSLSKEMHMVFIPGDTTKLRTEHTAGQGGGVLIDGGIGGESCGAAAAGSSLEISCSEYCCCGQEILQVSNDAVG